MYEVDVFALDGSMVYSHSSYLTSLMWLTQTTI